MTNREIDVMEGVAYYMEDIFTEDIFEKLDPLHSVSFKFEGTPLPTNQDFYFVAKWHEIFERYTTARLFVRKALEDNWDYWFNRIDDDKVQRAVEYSFKAELYETALLSYNILVDLTWTWTYVSAEYVLYSFDGEGNVTNAEDICGMHPIEEAYELLRKTENGVSSPHAEGNPFTYLKVMIPKFSEAVETIVEFWKVFSNSSIRNLYNFVKHKGKPLYEETEKLRGRKLMSIYIDDEECPSDIRDVQKIISVEKGLQELIDFDNNMLFPYVEKLLNHLKIAVDPSPLTFV